MGDAAPQRGARLFVSTMRAPTRLLARGWWDLHIEGSANLPDPPFVLAANHFSFADPVLATVVLGYNIRYLALSDLFGVNAAVDGLVRFFGGIPTPRDRVPVGAVRAALAELEAGRAVGLFPEGRRVERWGETAPRRGAAWLALRAGVPLVPMAIVGSDGTLGVVERRFRRTAVGIWVEPPLDPAHHAGEVDPVGSLTEAWREVLARRLDHWDLPESAGG